MNYLGRIEYYCKERQLSHSRFESLAGISKGLISKWTHNGVFPSHRSLEKVSRVLGISVNELMLGCEDDLYDHINESVVKHSGSTLWRNMIELDWDDLSRAGIPFRQLFSLPVNDDSMSPVIQRNDRILVHSQDNAEEGDIVILTIGDRPVCRRVFPRDDGLILQSFNTGCSPMYFSPDDILTHPVVIRGKVVVIEHRIG